MLGVMQRKVHAQLSYHDDNYIINVIDEHKYLHLVFKFILIIRKKCVQHG